MFFVDAFLLSLGYVQTMRRNLVVGIWIVTITCVLAWFLFVEAIRPRMVLHGRLHLARSIVVACKLYAIDHGGKFPAHLPTLVPTYLPDARYLTFPSGDGKRRLAFEYFGGTDTGNPNDVALRVAAERPEGEQVIVHVDTTGAIVPVR
jgi:hypothetical protein